MLLNPAGGVLKSSHDSSRSGRTTDVDPRVAAFCDRNAPEVFHSIAHRHEIWRADPFDVSSIHEEARDVFARLLHRVTTPPGLPAGRILLLKGESGSGKTHLMRVFRNHVHAQRLGYCAYLQMTSSSRDYDRYLLSNLIDSLDQPYFEAQTEASGLKCLSDALVEIPSAILRSEQQALREDDFTDEDLGELIGRLADEIREDDRFSAIDVHLIQALLYLQRAEPRIKARVLSYLRCEDLSNYDRRILGGILPRRDADRTIEALGRLMWYLQGVSLVVCIDQLEDMYQVDDAGERFRRAMSTVCDVADRVPSSIWVISCLEDYYEQLRERLTRSMTDRIEEADPTPLRLESRRSSDEVYALVACRLRHLYEEEGVEFDASDPTFPFPKGRLDELVNLRTRDVLNWCREYQERCIRAGRLVGFEDSSLTAEAGLLHESPPDSASLADSQAVIGLEQAWNDFRAGRTQITPQEDSALAELLEWAVERCSDETGGGLRFSASVSHSFISVEAENTADQSVELLEIGICNKNPRGGGLGKQVEQLEARAGEHKPVVVRSTDFPQNPRAEVVRQIGRLVAKGGRRVVVEDSDWRTMASMRAFRQQHGTADGHFTAWLREERPLSRLKSLREILGIDELTVTSRDAETREAVRPREQPKAAPRTDREVAEPLSNDPLVLGITRGRRVEPVTFAPSDLRMHAAFLGGSGSGKTTLALGILEQLLQRCIPAVLIDRKGDLCGYATDEFWSAPLPDSDAARRRDALRKQLDVRIFTPGNPQGNSLSIPLVPEGLGELPSFEREQAIQYAAAALAGMMNYKQSQSDRTRFAMLGQAIRLLAELDEARSPTLEDLIEFVGVPDPALVAAVGRLDPKNLAKLAENLETLRLTRGALLADSGSKLEIDQLFGRETGRRTQLSIISAKFLGDNAGIEFWLSQFLMAVSRWASRHPSSELQAVLMLDEADMYLPAQRQPATKGPLEDLLKRARSAGISLFLATQSPGDFDYKCRDNIRNWFVGRVKEKTALDKIAPMLGDSRHLAMERVPAQTTGQFYLACDGNVTPFDAARSLLQTQQLSEEQIVRLSAKRSCIESDQTEPI